MMSDILLPPASSLNEVTEIDCAAHDGRERRERCQTDSKVSGERSSGPLIADLRVSIPLYSWRSPFHYLGEVQTCLCHDFSSEPEFTNAIKLRVVRKELCNR
jgi:hypothetical protein